MRQLLYKKEKLQSVFLQQKMLENSQYLPMYGSSEFLRMDAYHPSNYFKVNPVGFTPFLIGTGGTQSLAHILNMTSTMDELEGKKSSLCSITTMVYKDWCLTRGFH